MLGHSTMVAAA
jgi:zeaxanthin glucosyltransferase